MTKRGGRQRLSCLILGVLWSMAVAVAARDDGRFLLMEWNVENLYDTCRNELIDDADFQPQGAYAWTQRRYLHKLRIIAQTIASAGGVAPVDLVALCEVENDSVLTQLTRRSVLGRLGYRYVMTHSADRRGMNVALLYRPGRFRPLAVRTLRIPRNSQERPTRDVLHVTGLVPTLDTLDVYVCHLPSRSGGRWPTDDYRMRGAAMVRHDVDSVCRFRKHPMVVVTGDFNDEPADNSLRRGLRAQIGQPQRGDDGLWLLTDDLRTSSGVAGTYFFQGRWNRLDHVVVNAALLQSDYPFRLARPACHILDFPWLLKYDARGRSVPRRTYLGTFYQGGVSDHLPLLVQFEF